MCLSLPSPASREGVSASVALPLLLLEFRPCLQLVCVQLVLEWLEGVWALPAGWRHLLWGTLLCPTQGPSKELAVAVGSRGSVPWPLERGPHGGQPSCSPALVLFLLIWCLAGSQVSTVAMGSRLRSAQWPRAAGFLSSSGHLSSLRGPRPQSPSGAAPARFSSWWPRL